LSADGILIPNLRQYSVVSYNTVLKIQSFILTCLACHILVSCNQKGGEKSNISKKDSLVLEVRFHPAFEENAEATLLKTDSARIFKILIRNNFRADKSEDTFWFKMIYLTSQEYLQIDSTLIKLCRQNIARKNYVTMDGIGISTLLVDKTDTNGIYFHSPHKNSDSIGYDFSKSLFEIFKNTFQDTLITDYFDDLETYIDESKPQKTDPRRKIDQLRMEKYHWSFQRSK